MSVIRMLPLHFEEKASEMYIERTHYYAKPGMADEVRRTRMRACAVREVVGLKRGTVLHKVDPMDGDLTLPGNANTRLSRKGNATSRYGLTVRNSKRSASICEPATIVSTGTSRKWPTVRQYLAVSTI